MSEKQTIAVYEFTGEGMQRVYENPGWMVGIKNWKPANDISGMDMLERHNQTDELFALLCGECTLIYAVETGSERELHAVKMEPGKVYCIPATLWHNTVTQKDTKLVLIEDPGTGADNSDFYTLSAQEIAVVQALCRPS